MVWAVSTVVTLGATALGAGASIYGAKKGVKAQEQAGKDASAAAMTAQREAQAFEQKQIDQSRLDNADWLSAGRGAVNQLAQRTGAGGDLSGQSNAFSTPFNFQADPGYAFRQAEGMKGITNSAAARGMLLSGAALKASSRYNQDFASNEYGNAFGRYQTENTNQFNRDQSTQTNQFNRLASLANVGQVAANQNGNNAMQFGGSVGNALMGTAGQVGKNTMGAANARASSYLAQGNALTDSMNQGVSLWNRLNSGERPPNYGMPNASNVVPGSWTEG